MARKATQYLALLLGNNIVNVEFDKRDKYRRIVGKILFNDLDINLAMIKAGYAWHYKKHQREQSKNDKLIYALAENVARSQSIGIFQYKSPVAPWKWRKNKKSTQSKA